MAPVTLYTKTYCGLSKQAKAGHLRSALGRSEPAGQKFVAALKRFLRRHGYSH